MGRLLIGGDCLLATDDGGSASAAPVASSGRAAAAAAAAATAAASKWRQGDGAAPALSTAATKPCSCSSLRRLKRSCTCI